MERLEMYSTVHVVGIQRCFLFFSSVLLLHWLPSLRCGAALFNDCRFASRWSLRMFSSTDTRSDRPPFRAEPTSGL